MSAKWVGRYRSEIREGISGITERRSYGTFTGTLNLASQAEAVVCRGTWRIQNGFLCDAVTESSKTELIRPVALSGPREDGFPSHGGLLWECMK